MRARKLAGKAYDSVACSYHLASCLDGGIHTEYIWVLNRSGWILIFFLPLDECIIESHSEFVFVYPHSKAPCPNDDDDDDEEEEVVDSGSGVPMVFPMRTASIDF